MTSTKSPPTSDWDWLQRELRALVPRIRQTLRTLDAHQHVAALDWEVWQLAAHMASLPGIYRRTVLSPSSFSVPPNMDAFGVDELNALGTSDLTELCDILATGVDELLETLGPDAAAPASFYLMTHTAEGVGGVLLNELLLHHVDLGVVAGENVPVSDRHVAAILRGIVPASTMFTSRAVAERCAGTYHLSIRGGDDYTYHVDNGSVTASPGRPKRADVRISAVGDTFLAIGFGRLNPITAVLRGNIMAWGTKPWLLRHFANLFVEDLSQSSLVLRSTEPSSGTNQTTD